MNVYAITDDNQLLELPVSSFTDFPSFITLDVNYTFEHLPDDRYFNIVSILVVIFGFSPLEVFLEIPRIITNTDTLKLNMRFNKEYGKPN